MLGKSSIQLGAEMTELTETGTEGTEKKLVSIILPFKNSRETITQAVASVVFQTHTNLEIILIDDGSTDDGLSLARAYRDPRIKLLSDGLSKGLPARLNEGVQLATGDYIARMDADDIMLPWRIERQLDFFTQNDYDVIGALAYDISKDAFILGIRHPYVEKNPLNILGRTEFIHSTVFGNKSWFRANPYREEMLRAQDFELWARCREHSKYFTIQEPLIFYRVSDYRSIQSYIETQGFVLRASLELMREPSLMKTSWLKLAVMAKIFLRIGAYYSTFSSARHALNLFSHKNIPTEVTLSLFRILSYDPGLHLVKGIVSPKPVVSIILPCLNPGQEFIDCIQSILEQTFPDWELLIIDDGSSEPIGGRFLDDPRIRVYRSPMTRGLPSRLNAAIDLAQGEFIARMDSDDIMTKERLGFQVEQLRRSGDDLMGSNAIRIDRNGAILGVLKSAPRPAAGWANFFCPMVHPSVMGTAVWFRRFLYDPRFKRAEDFELWSRALPSSRISNTPKQLIYYRISSGMSSRIKYFQTSRDRFSIYAKASRGKLLPLVYHFARYFSSAVAMHVCRLLAKR